MKVQYGVQQAISYRVVREFDDDTTSGMVSCGEFSSLEQAELAAKRLSNAEAGSSWYTVRIPKV